MREKEPAGSAGKAYEKPAIVWEERLEVRGALAIVCSTKNFGGAGNCSAGPTS